MKSATYGRLLLPVGLMLWSAQAFSQPFWGPVGLHTSLVGNLFTVYTSADGERIYYGGALDFDLDATGWQNMLVRYSAQGVELIAVNGQINSIVEFHDTLFIGGHFETNPAGSDTIPAYDVEYWNGSGWSVLGVFNDWSVKALRVLDDTLYAVGSFSEVDGQPCSGMVRLKTVIGNHCQF